MTLPTAAAECRAAAPLLLSAPEAVRGAGARSRRSISPARKALSSKPASHCCCRSIGQTDGHSRLCSAYYVGSVNHMQHVTHTHNCYCDVLSRCRESFGENHFYESSTPAEFREISTRVTEYLQFLFLGIESLDLCAEVVHSTLALTQLLVQLANLVCTYNEHTNDTIRDAILA